MDTAQLRRDGAIVAVVTVLGLLALGMAVSVDRLSAGPRDLDEGAEGPLVALCTQP